MAYINLLPWREEVKKAQKQEYVSILALVGLMAFALVFIVSQFYQAGIDGQVSRNQFLKDEIKVLDIKIAEINTLNQKKTALQQRISVIEQLQRSRNVGTQVLNEISKIVLGGIYLIKLEKQGSSILLIGKSESNNHLSNMIREIEASELFVNAVLESIVSNDAKSKLLSEFKMRVRIEGLKDEAAIQGAK